LENVGRDVFADRNSGALLEFERDGRGRIGAVVVQAGRVRNLRFVRGSGREPVALRGGQP
jgi:hypothetical protein